jgi:hypothetical protein
LVTLNDTRDYTWKAFEIRSRQLMDALFSAYPDAIVALRIGSLQLRYIDAIPLDFERTDVFQFLADNLKTTLAFSPALFTGVPVKAAPKGLNAAFEFSTEHPAGTLRVRLARGKRQDADAQKRPGRWRQSDPSVPSSLHRTATSFGRAMSLSVRMRMSTGFRHKTENSFSFLQGADPRYPTALRACFGSAAPAVITALGDLALLDRRPLAIFCSARCPGSLIVQASDLAHALAERGAAVIGDFHTPVERACLEILLAGAGPLIVCPARGMYKIISAGFRKPLAAGRLLLLSPFDAAERRVTAELAAYRNRFVAALAERVLFIHTAPGSRTEALAREVRGGQAGLRAGASDQRGPARLGRAGFSGWLN